jgi:hypothetical protein
VFCPVSVTVTFGRFCGVLLGDTASGSFAS